MYREDTQPESFSPQERSVSEIVAISGFRKEIEEWIKEREREESDESWEAWQELSQSDDWQEEFKARAKEEFKQLQLYPDYVSAFELLNQGQGEEETRRLLEQDLDEHADLALKSFKNFLAKQEENQ